MYIRFSVSVRLPWGVRSPVIYHYNRQIETVSTELDRDVSETVWKLQTLSRILAPGTNTEKTEDSMLQELREPLETLAGKIETTWRRL
jgi:hypothetical protein